jgi:hypothetical protein
VETYWNGVLRRLQAEVEDFNRLITHHGERGRANEHALARILQSLIPSRYAVGTGLIIDSSGMTSKQCDVVLFEQADQPRLFAQTTQLLYLLETVRAVIEVKTTMDKGDIRDAAAKKLSIDALSPVHPYRDNCTHPLFMLFAYDADAYPDTVAANLLALPPEQRPDLVCVIEPGFVAGDPKLIRPPGEDSQEYLTGVTLLLNDDGRPVERKEDNRVDHDGHGKGGSHPKDRHNEKDMRGDPARALLLFADGLLRGLAARGGSSLPESTAYISSQARHLAPLAPLVS